MIFKRAKKNQKERQRGTLETGYRYQTANTLQARPNTLIQLEERVLHHDLRLFKRDSKSVWGALGTAGAG